MSKDADNPIVVSGSFRTIEYAIAANGSMPAREFVENLSVAEKAKIAQLFRKMADLGKLPNREQFKSVRGGICEFKKHQIRVFCFRKDDRWILTNGYKKKRNKLARAEVDRAERIMREHLEREVSQHKGRRT